MKKKNCKLTGILRVIALPLVGSAGGFLYYRYVGCCCIPSCGPAAAKGRMATGRSDPCSP